MSINGQAAGLSEKWNLLQAESSIHFVSVKKGSIAEAHHFSDFSGVIDHNKATITIKPDSVDTNIGIRDQRVREFLFETGIYPTISITSDVSAAIATVKKTRNATLDLPARLTLHGVTKEIQLKANLTLSGDDRLTVSSTRPIIIKAADYGMDGGVSKLANLVGGIMITSAVPVNFVLSFKK